MGNAVDRDREIDERLEELRNLKKGTPSADGKGGAIGLHLRSLIASLEAIERDWKAVKSAVGVLRKAPRRRARRAAAS